MTALPLAKEGFECPLECTDGSLHSLQLPPEFEDLTGVVQNDLKVIVSILTERATDRLLLSGASPSNSGGRSGTTWPRPSTRGSSPCRWSTARKHDDERP